MSARNLPRIIICGAVPPRITTMYNVEGEDGKLYYNDGTEFLGIGSGSNNYAATNPALTERVEADIKAFLEKNPRRKAGGYPHRFADGLRFRPGSAHFPGFRRNTDPPDR